MAHTPIEHTALRCCSSSTWTNGCCLLLETKVHQISVASRLAVHTHVCVHKIDIKCVVS